MKQLLFILAILIIIFAIGQSTKILPQLNINKYVPPGSSLIPGQKGSGIEKQNVVYEESVVTQVVQDSLPSVVTVGIQKTTSAPDTFQFDPLNPFSPFRQSPGQQQNVEGNIGSGFIISSDGLILTNKHVVSDTEAKYTVLTNDSKKYNVEKIYRDPLNDIAIIKVSAPITGFKPLPLGDSTNLKLGQLVIAIGTPLGEFTNTVTSGIVSGLGRGITAGSPFEGYVEKLDNVIQTDAAISPGNSGGPLLNSKGQVIGINTAVAQEGQNIGFAIPVNVIKEIVTKFNDQGGTFERPYLGVRYQMIDKQTAIANKLASGAYIRQVIDGSPAQKAGLQEEDIIIEFDGKTIDGSDDQGLTKILANKKVGDSVTVKIWRGGQTLTKNLTLEAAQ